MKKQSLLLFVAAFMAVISCRDQKKNDQFPNQETAKYKLNGKVYRVGPQLDSATTQSYGECDCCMSQVAFIDDSTFVAINECMYNNGYFKGRYTTTGDTVKLTSDSLFILAVAEEEQIGKTTRKIHLEINTGPRTEFNWIKFSLNNKEGFKTNMDSLSYATQDTSSLGSFMNFLRLDSDSIPMILKLQF